MFEKKLEELGLIGPKYGFVLSPNGLLISSEDKEQLETIGKLSVNYIRQVDSWYHGLREGSRWLKILRHGIPQEYNNFPWAKELPVTMMIDCVYTLDGWKAVEIDTTNRNAYGYPLLLRELYGLCSVWKGIDSAWTDAGCCNITQISANPFYEPYYKFFLNRVGGRLIREVDLEEWLTNPVVDTLMDLPILHRSSSLFGPLLNLAEKLRIAIPPKHALASKAVSTLPWELEEFADNPIKKVLPEGRLVSKDRQIPIGPFFLKQLQNGGSHGVFFNDNARLEVLKTQKRPGAIWQNALPIVARTLQYLDEQGKLQTDDFNVRVSIFVTREGRVVDADVTANKSEIVHGNNKSLLTVPVLG